MNRILVVDDDESIVWALSRALAGPDRVIAQAASAEEALELAKGSLFDLVFLDIRLPGQDGLAIMQALRALTKGAPVVVMTGHGTLQTAVKAVEEGAFDYLSKPFDLDAALACAQRALSRSRAHTADLPPQPLPETPELVGSCPAMQEVFKRVALAAVSSATVLISGESGTRKELVSFGPFAPNLYTVHTILAPDVTPDDPEFDLFVKEVAREMTGKARCLGGGAIS